MASTTVASRPRRTQADRTAHTRSALLRAAIECIAERGYAATTTTEIARRAGLSRGAQLNHFATKAELMVAALEQFYADRRAEFRAAISDLPQGEDRLERAIDLLWSFVSHPTFVAWLELEVAARTDPTLRRHVVQAEQSFRDVTEQTWRELFPGDDSDVAYRVAPTFAFAVLEGLGLARAFGSRTPAEIDATLTAFKSLARLALGTLGGPKR